VVVHDFINVADVLFPTDALHTRFFIIVGFYHDPLAAKMLMAHNGWLRVTGVFLQCIHEILVMDSCFGD